MPSRSKMINIKKANTPIEVRLSAGDIIKSIKKGLLPNKDLPMEPRTVHILSGLKHSLVSIKLFCENACLTIFDEK